MIFFSNKIINYKTLSYDILIGLYDYLFFLFQPVIINTYVTKTL